MSKERTLFEIAENVDLVLPRYQAKLDKFIVQLAENPEYAFFCANNAVEAGVRVRALQELKAISERPTDGRPLAATDEEWLTVVQDHYNREARRMAQDMPSSTSHMSNLVDNYKRCYYAVIAAWLSGEYFTSL